jgi:acetyl esterase/lipase
MGSEKFYLKNLLTRGKSVIEYAVMDPGLFDAESIDPETSEFNKNIEKVLSSQPPLYRLKPKMIRAARAAGHSIWGPIKRMTEVKDRVVPGSAGEVPIRVFRPDRIKGVYFHIHGGGFMLGRADHHDEILVETGRKCGVAVVSVDYRLAPENPYPAATDDCETAAVWLVKNALAEFGTNRLIIGGESAGANLSVATLLRMRDRHNFKGFSGAVLTYGVYDLTMTPSARRWGERNLILTTKVMEWFHKNYVAAEKSSDPDVSPLYADLSGMPPALFTVGTLDPLIDDSLFMHLRWQTAGNPSALAVYPGGIHAFNAFPIELARKANTRIFNFIRDAVI